MILALLDLAAEGALGFGAGVAQVTDPDYIDDAGRIIGSPDAGPSPENPGDRGGYAQLLTLAVLIAAVCFIAWRVRREIARARTSA